MLYQISSFRIRTFFILLTHSLCLPVRNSSEHPLTNVRNSFRHFADSLVKSTFEISLVNILSLFSESHSTKAAFSHLAIVRNFASSFKFISLLSSNSISNCSNVVCSSSSCGKCAPIKRSGIRGVHSLINSRFIVTLASDQTAATLS